MATPPKRGGKKPRALALRSKKSAISAAKAAVEQDHETHVPPGRTSVTAQKSDTGHAANLPTASADERLTIFTIGHSTRPIDEFIGLLKEYGIEQLVDVRTVPKSRHVPQFNSEPLASALSKQGIAYVHLKALGGLRHAKRDSVNTGWRNPSFRGYADYMSTEEFAQGIDRLVDLAKKKRTVIMCAEAVPWRCHRSLIGDALLVRGIAAKNIMSATSIRPHTLTEFARVDGRQIIYPADKNLELFSERAIEGQ